MGDNEHGEQANRCGCNSRTCWMVALVISVVAVAAIICLIIVALDHRQLKIEIHLLKNQPVLEEGCPPGWTKHTSHCFNMYQEAKTWEDARIECLHYGGDLTVDMNAEDHAFLTNVILEFIQQHPQVNIEGVWIGLQDLVEEGIFKWVNGKAPEVNATFWRSGEPNNLVMDWDRDEGGQDCAVLVPKASTELEYEWDDIICGGSRQYICQTNHTKYCKTNKQ